MLKNLGDRIRLLRHRSGLRLDDVAARCGFTKSLLSKIETGAVNPPVATLVAIARAMGVTVATLIDDGPAVGTVVTRAAAPDERTDKGYLFRLLAGERADKAMQPFLFTARRGEVKAGALRHAGQEFVYILDGAVEYRVGRTTHALGTGDSLYFDSDEDHDVAPTSPTATWLAMFIEPGGATPPNHARKTEASWERRQSAKRQAPRRARPAS
ncbi:MAG TPA: XRE family transcriptional regulator [Planctomycetota bacterium]|nr:XRE family transcriptional regulator [Planctomycetota bacterium]